MRFIESFSHMGRRCHSSEPPCRAGFVVAAVGAFFSLASAGSRSIAFEKPVLPGSTGMPPEVAGYVYFYGQRQGEEAHTYFGRAPQDAVDDRSRYEFFAGLAAGMPRWSRDEKEAQPVFTDSNGTGDLTSVVYAPALRRYLLTNFHKGPGQLGIFDGPHPWGPWTTVAYEEAWGKMGSEGAGLTCSFPQKWMSADGRTLWCIFSVYGEGAKQGIQAHDKFNLVKATLICHPDRDQERQKNY